VKVVGQDAPCAFHAKGPVRGWQARLDNVQPTEITVFVTVAARSGAEGVTFRN
jgi:hypothetical protein